jgi:MYXO-CTERM domain-containing protein
VAKNAILVPIRIYDCSNSGSLAQALLGIDFVLRKMKDRSGRRAVVSMSFGGDDSLIMDAALIRLEASGAVVVAAAGNEGNDACSVSPANGRGVVCVASVSINDALSSFSNRGPCVSLSAPGEQVVGADFQSDQGYRVMSGTSMSTPLVAGAIANFLSFSPLSSVAEAREAVICGATVDAVDLAPAGTSTRLLYADPEAWAAARNLGCAVSGTGGHDSPTVLLFLTLLVVLLVRRV